jgi:hypothetical protein
MKTAYRGMDANWDGYAAAIHRFDLRMKGIRADFA